MVQIQLYINHQNVYILIAGELLIAAFPQKFVQKLAHPRHADNTYSEEYTISFCF